VADYGGNSLAVQFQRNPIDRPLPETKSQALPAHRPNAGWYMPGGKYPAMKTLPKPSWQGRARRSKRRKSQYRFDGEAKQFGETPPLHIHQRSQKIEDDPLDVIIDLKPHGKKRLAADKIGVWLTTR
jgi:hypothetical protein